MLEKTLYQILGVPEDSSFHDIKRAYKHLAQRLHPDKNPNQEVEEEFLLIQEAFRILSDPDKRKEYDSIGKANPTDIESRAHNNLLNLFSQAFDQVQDETTQNLVQEIMNHLIRSKSQLETALTGIDNTKKKLNRIKKRLSCKKKKNILDSVIDNKIMASIQEEHSIQQEIKVIDLMLEMIQDFDYKTDPSQDTSTTIISTAGYSPTTW